MGSTKHEKSFVDFEQPYEQNVIGLKGIVYFGIGLFLLIVITFGLMAALLNVFNQDAKTNAGPANPMAQRERDRLPPEPRLQLAPGFGVEGPDGKVNLELRAPQSEFWELEKQWKDMWEHGLKDPHTGAVTAMPIEEAKQKMLGQARPSVDPAVQQKVDASKLYFSDASSGRRATEKRR